LECCCWLVGSTTEVKASVVVLIGETILGSDRIALYVLRVSESA
jgi:hypothetical protein